MGERGESVAAADLLNRFAAAGKRVHVAGDLSRGVIIGLDLEGRLYSVYNGRVLNRVNPVAISGASVMETYHNPGGDGLWPAPEGTRLGYSYATGSWRVPSGIRHARFQVIAEGADHAVVASEVDLINSQGTGIPLLFERDVRVKEETDGFTVSVGESMTYLGSRTLQKGTFLLSPWSLCQFDCGEGCEVVFAAEERDVWDLYDDPDRGNRYWEGGICHAITDGTRRYQIGLGPAVAAIEYRDPLRRMRVVRDAAILSDGLAYADIRDAAPEVPPSEKGVRYSVYSDAGGFMEIEAAGGCPQVLEPGTKLTQFINTRYIFE
ncbi:hypothetical protein GCM10023091_12190 [Ravibacter arvi]|uniref:Uncharacterized protein n=1 Tax=Ravibacter arvi TaxID=2051041 RepID=A0ABP8LSC0_9BACT